MSTTCTARIGAAAVTSGAPATGTIAPAFADRLPVTLRTEGGAR
jgi:hypothetical protein